MTQPAGSALLDLVAVMDRLRSPGGCPWDAEQTHASLLPYLVEETYEAVEAIESGDRAHMAEELGDVLLQVAFHARVAQDDELPVLADRLQNAEISQGGTQQTWRNSKLLLQVFGALVFILAALAVVRGGAHRFQVEQARASNRPVVDFYDRVTGRADPRSAVPNPLPAV